MIKQIVSRLIFTLATFCIGICSVIAYPSFTMTGNVEGDNYSLLWFQPSLSSDPQAVTLYRDSTSAHRSAQLYMSSLENSEILDRTPEFDFYGNKIGDRRVFQLRHFNDAGELVNGNVRICWFKGTEFWYIDAADLRLARSFEKSYTMQVVMAEAEKSRSGRP